MHDSFTSSHKRAGSMLAIVIMLVGCGGGGDPADSASSHAESSDNPAQTQAELEQPSALTSTTISANCGLANFADEALQRLNAYRARGASCGWRGTFGPSAALAWHSALNSAAARHSSDMQARNVFSHTGSDGSNPGTRIRQAGYAWLAWGESIAAGYGSVQSVVDGWMASPGHCANIMNPSLREVGLACVRGGSTNTYRTYWTLDLARR